MIVIREDMSFLLWLLVLGGVAGVYVIAGLLPLPQLILPSLEEPPLRTSSAHQIISPAILRIPVVDIETSLIFPAGTDPVSLKAALNQGAVHYPDSHPPSDVSGNVFIFGHSSARAEKNPARTVFSRLNQLNMGDDIEVQFEGVGYLYRVDSVRVLKPDQAEIYFDTTSRRITLSTCWPIGDPTNRFVVEGEFVKTYPLQNERSAADPSS